MLDKTSFFEEFKVEKEFRNSGLEWKTLEEIYDDYVIREKEFEQSCKEIENYILEESKMPIHSMRIRKKDPKHLIEKIIRKRGKEQNTKYIGINISNYREIIRDLIGIRILVLSKEEWEEIFEWICKKFPEEKDDDICMAEPPVAYTRYGDRDIFKGKIHKEHTNKGYRSQHYVVKYQKFYAEIQVRTLAEEVYGEFDHKVKYPYRDSNKFLKRYTNSMSQLIDAIDEIMSTCFQMGADGWEACNDYYDEDQYEDWQHTSQRVDKNIETDIADESELELEFSSWADYKLKRRRKE